MLRSLKLQNNKYASVGTQIKVFDENFFFPKVDVICFLFISRCREITKSITKCSQLWNFSKHSYGKNNVDTEDFKRCILGYLCPNIWLIVYIQYITGFITDKYIFKLLKQYFFKFYQSYENTSIFLIGLLCIQLKKKYIFCLILHFCFLLVK